MAGERRGEQTSTGEKVANGLLAGHEKAMEMVGDHMLRAAPKMTRFVVKKIPGAPGLVYDFAQIAAAKPEDKVRQTFGAVGGFLGSAGGGGLGMLTGPAAPVAAPVGAAVGGAIGEDIGTDIYDRNKAVIDRGVATIAAPIQRAGSATAEDYHDAHRKLEDTRRWIEDRNADLRRRFGR